MKRLDVVRNLLLSFTLAVVLCTMIFWCFIIVGQEDTTWLQTVEALLSLLPMILLFLMYSYVLAFPTLIVGYFVSVYMIEHNARNPFIWILASSVIGIGYALAIMKILITFSYVCSPITGLLMWSYTYRQKRKPSINDDVAYIEEQIGKYERSQE